MTFLDFEFYVFDKMHKFITFLKKKQCRSYNKIL